jgi:hypothetical protein
VVSVNDGNLYELETRDNGPFNVYVDVPRCAIITPREEQKGRSDFREWQERATKRSQRKGKVDSDLKDTSQVMIGRLNAFTHTHTHTHKHTHTHTQKHIHKHIFTGRPPPQL